MNCPKLSGFVSFRTVVPSAVATALLAIGFTNPVQAQTYALTLDGSPVYERLDATDDYLIEDNSYIDTYTFTQGKRMTKRA